MSMRCAVKIYVLETIYRRVKGEDGFVLALPMFSSLNMKTQHNRFDNITTEIKWESEQGLMRKSPHD